MVESWYKIGLLLIFVMFYFIFIGPVLDGLWLYAHTVSPTLGYYTAEDLDHITGIYSIMKYVPVYALIIMIVHAIADSNTQGM
jgi:hypothetical protein